MAVDAAGRGAYVRAATGREAHTHNPTADKPIPLCMCGWVGGLGPHVPYACRHVPRKTIETIFGKPPRSSPNGFSPTHTYSPSLSAISTRLSTSLHLASQGRRGVYLVEELA
jgi:hypothetical protein